MSVRPENIRIRMLNSHTKNDVNHGLSLRILVNTRKLGWDYNSDFWRVINQRYRDIEQSG